MTAPLIKLIKGILPGAFASAGNANPSEPAMLIRSTPGSRTPGAAIDGTNPTDANYPCKVVPSNETHESIGGTLVEATDRVVGVLGGTLSVAPRKGDRLTLDGKTMRVESLQGSAALWTLLLRG